MATAVTKKLTALKKGFQKASSTESNDQISKTAIATAETWESANIWRTERFMLPRLSGILTGCFDLTKMKLCPGK